MDILAPGPDDVDRLRDLGYSDEEADEVTGAEDEGTSMADRFPSLDWHAAFAIDFSQVDWLPGKFMERGQQVALIGDGKSGKSLFVLEWLWRAVTGRRFLGDERRDPIKVLYFDRENSLRDIITRLQAMGASPDELVNGFDYRMFPRFSGQLDTSAAAAAELAQIVEEVQPDVVILDTASRFIAGKENDADTWLQLYARVHADLKRCKVACVRIDHLGKDKEKGARGSSAKTQDVDHVWELTTISENRGRRDGVETIVTQLKLKRTHTRTGLGEDELTVTRRGRKSLQSGQWIPGQTRHELTSTEGTLAEGGVEPAEGTSAWLIQRLDAAKIPDGPQGWGNPKVISWCATAGIKMSKEKIAEAVRLRRSRTASYLPGDLPGASIAGEGLGESPRFGEGQGVFAGEAFPGKAPGRSGEPHSSAPSPALIGGGEGAEGRRWGERLGTCLGCNTPMTILTTGQLYHVSDECERLYREKHGEPPC